MSGLACHDIRLSLGVYVVGAIDPADRASIDVHLSQCPECREELAGLAGLPALLHRVPVADAERLALGGIDPRDLEEPSAALLSSLLDRVAARRKAARWRGLTAAAAAAVIAVGGGLAVGVAASGHRGQPAQVPAGAHPVTARWPDRVRATDTRTHVSAEVSYAPEVSGTTMQIHVSGVKDGTTCDFWVLTAHGQRWRAGRSWTVVPGREAAWYGASSPLPAVSLTSFEITAAGKLLVKIPAS